MAQAQILVVDDSAEVAFILGHIGRRAGWDVVSRREAEQAGPYLRQHRPDLVVLDVNLPGCNGFDFCRSLRSESAFRHLPIALFSQWQRAEDIVRALDAGADCVVSKDLLARPNDCRQRLAEILGWAANRVPPVPICFGEHAPSVRLLVEIFNRAIRETLAGRLGADLTCSLLERGAADWLTPDRRELDASRLENEVSPEAVAAFITAFVEKCWRVLGSMACEPLWRSLGAEFPASEPCPSSSCHSS